MPSVVWAHLILSSATLHSTSSMALCYQVAWHYSGAMRVVHSVVVAL
jgi:hypothetical protein